MRQTSNDQHGQYAVKTSSKLRVLSLALAAFALVAAIACMTSCSSGKEPESYTLDKTLTSNGVTIQVPSSWESKTLDTKDAIGDSWQSKPPTDGVIQLATVINTNLTPDEFVDQFISAFAGNDDYASSFGDKTITEESGHKIYKMPFSANIDNAEFEGTLTIVSYDGFYTSCIAAAPKDASAALATAIDDIANSIKVETPETHTVAFKNADGSVIEEKTVNDYGYGAVTPAPANSQAGEKLDVSGWTLPEDSDAYVLNTDGLFSIRGITANTEVVIAQ